MTEDLNCGGAIQNVSLSGAMVAAVQPAPVRVADCVRLRFSVPSSIRISVCAKVRWVSDRPNADGMVEFGVQFYGLSRVEREVILKHAHADLDGSAEAPDVAISRKYSVRREDAKLWVWVAGIVREQESRNLHAVVRSRIAECFGKPLLAFLDFRELGTCPPESLRDFRAWLAILGRAKPFGGVLLTEDSVTSVQVRRLVREAKVADSLVAFTEPAEAKEFWTVLAQTFSPEPPGRRRGAAN